MGMDTITIVVEKDQVRNVISTDGVTPKEGFNICMMVAHQLFHPQMVKEEAEKLNKEKENAKLAEESVSEGDKPSGDKSS